jgi:deoxyribodipyrimidine photo-lyase
VTINLKECDVCHISNIREKIAILQKPVSMMPDARLTALSMNTVLRKGPVIYWMSRDQRTADNHALLHAQQLAMETASPLIIVFCLAPSFGGAAGFHYRFMLKGLQEVGNEAKKLNIPLVILPGDPPETISRFAREIRAGAVVTDFNPLRLTRTWKDRAAELLDMPLLEVDAHNIVPARFASQKAEFSARTIRPKILKLLPEYLVEPALPVVHPYSQDILLPQSDQEAVGKFLQDGNATGVETPAPGAEAARQVLGTFIRGKLVHYAEQKNDPTKDVLSGLSPYLHFGQIAPLRVALEVQRAGGPGAAVYLEELIIRRELADNFCLYNPRYDSFEGFPPWARKTLKEHWNDTRGYLYTPDELENASTHDPLWNAAQAELVKTGKMHGYLRMYWAKKILEWSDNPAEAMAVAISLNDRHSLDGRDPNGYAGIAWSIGGVHDRPWFTRPVFGSIRYMSYDGCRRKFDVDKYICNINKL